MKLVKQAVRDSSCCSLFTMQFCTSVLPVPLCLGHQFSGHLHSAPLHPELARLHFTRFLTSSSPPKNHASAFDCKRYYELEMIHAI